MSSAVKSRKKLPMDYRNPEAHPGWNADRKKCRICRYRVTSALRLNAARCDYLGIAGHVRGCAAEDCDRYVKGSRIERSNRW